MKTPTITELNAIAEAVFEIEIEREEGYVNSKQYAKEFNISESHAYKKLKGAYDKGRLHRIKSRDDFGQICYYYKPKQP